jgi:hypothetical protein
MDKFLKTLNKITISPTLQYFCIVRVDVADDVEKSKVKANAEAINSNFITIFPQPPYSLALLPA